MKYHEYTISKKGVNHRSLEAGDFFIFNGIGVLFETDKTSYTCLSFINVFHGEIFKYKFLSFREFSDSELNKLINKCWAVKIKR